VNWDTPVTFSVMIELAKSQEKELIAIEMWERGQI
jgi:hypothetical protein